MAIVRAPLSAPLPPVAVLDPGTAAGLHPLPTPLAQRRANLGDLAPPPPAGLLVDASLSGWAHHRSPSPPDKKPPGLVIRRMGMPKEIVVPEWGIVDVLMLYAMSNVI